MHTSNEYDQILDKVWSLLDLRLREFIVRTKFYTYTLNFIESADDPMVWPTNFYWKHIFYR